MPLARADIPEQYTDNTADLWAYILEKIDPTATPSSDYICNFPTFFYSLAYEVVQRFEPTFTTADFHNYFQDQYTEVVFALLLEKYELDGNPQTPATLRDSVPNLFQKRAYDYLFALALLYDPTLTQTDVETGEYLCIHDEILIKLADTIVLGITARAFGIATLTATPLQTYLVQANSNATATVNAFIKIYGTANVNAVATLSAKANFTSFANVFGSATLTGEFTDFTGYINTHTGAEAAYCVFYLLNNAYTGPLLTIRRSSDNAEESFYPDTNYFFSLNSQNLAQTTTLADFIGSDDGFIKTVYDHTNNGHHLTQTNASDQPQIISAGSIMTNGSKPTADLNLNKFIETTDSIITGGTNRTIIAIASIPTNVDYFIGLGQNGTGTRFSLKNDLNNYRVEIQGSGETTGLATSSQDLIFISSNGSNLNNVSLTINQGTTHNFTTSATINTSSGLAIGSRASAQAGETTGDFQALIIYASDKSSNQSQMQTDLNALLAL